MNFKQFINEKEEFLPFKMKYEGMFNAAYFNNGADALRWRGKHWKDILNDALLMELHIDISPENQGKGLAVKMIKSLLHQKHGNIWIAKGRIINPNVYKVIEKLKNDNFFKVTEIEDGFIIQEK